MKKYIILLAVFFTVCFNNIHAQDLLKTQDLSTLRVDLMTDAEVLKIQEQLKSKNSTIEEMEPMALSKGMSSSEFLKLKNRLKELSKDADKNANKKESVKKKKQGDDEEENEEGLRKQEEIVNKKVKDSLNALIFGSELFDNPTLNFQPNLKLATPMNYVLGPGDELQVSVYGVQEFNANVPVNVEGKVVIQYVGQISVAGMTIEAATQKIKNAIAGVYSTVRSGQSKVGVSLSRIRTIKVTIIGGKQPGNYSVSSLATVYNALFLSGGPGKNGSYRNIELIRNNKVYKNIDIYRFLISGNQSDNIGLKDNDVIRIPSYSHRVVVEGEVKRPGIFEMKKGETFSDLLSFTSGFNEFAYTASVNVIQKTAKEFKVKDIKAAEFNTYKPNSGDVFRVSRILNRFENRIKIEGAVFRPDVYSFSEGMRVSDLLAQAEGLKEDAYKQRAIITRKKSDLTTEIVNVDLAKVLEGSADANVLLKKEDVLTVYSILDFREEYKVTVDGEVKKPGEYDFYENLSLNDLLIQAGGLTGAASKKVEIARMIKAETGTDTNPQKAQLFQMEISAGNNEQAKNFILEPYDVVNIRKMGVYEKPQMVKVSGAVAYPGKYVLTSKKEKVYDVVMRAGGLTSLADINGMKIKRPIKSEQIESLQTVKLNLGKNDTIQKKLEKKINQELKYAIIPLNWKKISKKPKNEANVTLMAGDEIVTSELAEAVKVSGNVLLNSEIPYRKGKGFNYYINSAGGEDAKGWKKRAYVIYPNGRAAVTGSLFFIKTYPKVLPGSQIVVPEKPAVKKMSTAEIISIGSLLTSLTLVILTAFK